MSFMQTKKTRKPKSYQQSDTKSKSNTSTRFGELLSEAMHTLAEQQRRPLSVIQDEVAFALDRSGADAIYFWRKGNVPDLDSLEKLARIIYERSDLGQSWIREFLQSADHPNLEGFCRRLFHNQPSTIVLASTAQPSHFLLQKPYRLLIGRDEYVNQLIAVLSDPGAPRIVGIDGIGGIGKSALAIEIADICLQRQFFDRVIFVNVRTHHASNIPIATYEHILKEVAHELNLAEVAQSNSSESERRIRAILQRQRILLLLDNLETASEPQTRLIERLYPLLGVSRALLTSRQRFSGEVYPLNLHGLSNKPAHRFVEQELRDKGTTQTLIPTSLEINEIIEVTGGSPLAMKLILGQLRLLPMEQTLGNLRNFKRNNRLNEEDENVALFQYVYLSSWNLLGDLARKFLFSVSLFAPGIGGSFEALTAISDMAAEESQACIRDLWRVSFLEIQQGQVEMDRKRYLLHALTHYFVNSQHDTIDPTPDALSASSVMQDTIQRFEDYFGSYLLKNQQNLQGLDTEQENIFEALRYRIAHAHYHELIQDLTHFFPYAMTRGLYRQIREILERGITLAELNTTDDELATLHLQLATVLIKQGQVEQAVLLLNQSVKNHLRLKDQTLSCDLFCALAEAETENSDFVAAHNHLGQAIEISQSIQAQQQYGKALLLQGRVSIFASNHDQAKQYLSQALAVAENLRDEDLKALVIRNLSTVSGMTSDFEQAEHYSRQLLAYAEGKQHKELIGVALRNLSGSLAMRGDLEQAELYAKRGLEIAKEIGYLEHASGIYLNLGVMATGKKLWQKALDYTLEALPLAREMGNPERQRSTLANLTHYYLELGRTEEAIICLREATELTKQIETPWATADTQFVWARYYLRQRSFSEAKEAFAIVYQIASQAMIREMEADSLRYMAEIAYMENDLDTARKLGQRSLEIMDEIDYIDKYETRKWLDDLPQN